MLFDFRRFSTKICTISIISPGTPQGAYWLFSAIFYENGSGFDRVLLFRFRVAVIDDAYLYCCHTGYTHTQHTLQGLNNICVKKARKPIQEKNTGTSGINAKTFPMAYKRDSFTLFQVSHRQPGHKVRWFIQGRILNNFRPLFSINPETGSGRG